MTMKLRRVNALYRLNKRNLKELEKVWERTYKTGSYLFPERNDLLGSLERSMGIVQRLLEINK